MVELLKKLKDIAKNEGFLHIPFRLFSSFKNRVIKNYYKINYGFENAWFGLRPYVYGLKHCKLGKNFYAERYFRLEIITKHGSNNYSPICYIGKNVRVSDFTHIGCCHKLIIGNNVLIGSKVIITDHGHGAYSGSNQSSPSEIPNERDLFFDAVKIGDNVFIGDNVVILPGVQIGSGVIIAANTVITSRTVIPNNVIVGGSPLKILKSYNELTKSWEKYDNTGYEVINKVDGSEG